MTWCESCMTSAARVGRPVRRAGQDAGLRMSVHSCRCGIVPAGFRICCPKCGWAFLRRRMPGQPPLCYDQTCGYGHPWCYDQTCECALDFADLDDLEVIAPLERSIEEMVNELIDMFRGME